MDTKLNVDRDHVVTHLPFLRPRHEPDVPQDVDFLMDHFNDPNYDLRPHSKSSISSVETIIIRKEGDLSFSTKSTDLDTESQSESSRSCTTSKLPDLGNFDAESPYAEVRAAVSNIDDPGMPVNTFRMWFLGLVYTIIIAALNELFSLRFPTVVIGGIVAQLTALPLGKALEKVLPATHFRTFGYVWSFNPGPFNIKEHVMITVMANVVSGGMYATDVITAQKSFYDQQLSFGYQVMLMLSTQLIGFSLGGLLRRFLVWPASMIWPGALVNCALFNTLHRNYGKIDRRHMSREKFFCIVLVGSIVYYWLPGYIFTALSVFNWICWVAPNNAVVNQLFGVQSGLGMSVITFDWAMISAIGSPLVAPWWAEANIGAALVLFFWIITPIVYYTNGFFTSFLPISSSLSFANTGMLFDPLAILTNGTFDAAKYEAYSPMYITATQCIAYALNFASFTAIIVHTFFWYRRDIAGRFLRSLHDETDIHSHLMRAYPEVPQLWYACLGFVSLILMITTVEIFPTKLPIWGLFVALCFGGLLAVPVGMLQAVTNQQVTFQVMYEMFAGYMFPGRPVANMIFKCVAFTGTSQAVGFSGDFKIGHYMKIPPRIMFMGQVVSAFVGCFVAALVQNWAFANITDICTPTQVNGFSCPSGGTFATASMIWGTIGPARLFSPGQIYNPLLWFFLLGALAPIPFYFLARRYPTSFWRYINIPVFLGGVDSMPPASGLNYSSWVFVGFIFQWFMRRFHFRWWMRYNYILSAGLDAGVAVGLIVVFFTVQFPANGTIGRNTIQTWWGNTVWMRTADALGTPFKLLAPDQTFGPTSWS